MTTRDDIPDLAAQSAVSQTGPTAINGVAPDKATAKAIAEVDPQAERSAVLARVESSLTEHYIIQRSPVMVADMKIGNTQYSVTEYSRKEDGSRVAFTESTFRLATDTNSPSVVRSMVELAQARNWTGLRVSGAEEFRRLVWLEASVRGMKAVGYEPNPADLELLRGEREGWRPQRIEPARGVGSGDASAPSGKPSDRARGHKSVLVAIEAILIAKKVPQAKRHAVLAAATQQLARGTAVPKIKVDDRSAERHMPILPLSTDLNRTQDTAAATRIR